MNTLAVDGYDIRRQLGAGGCGRVFLAVGADGSWVVLKVFDGMAVSRALLARMTERLGVGGWPKGVMPVLHADFDSRPAVRVTPWLGHGLPDGNAPPTDRSLQSALAEFPGERSWPVVRDLVRALAAMHDRRVAHGNLKPGNVFLADDGGVLLTDWTLGLMPGVARFDFTDALLYQPPEQLTHPEGYLEEAGYRWDVFAFGTLAFRLLTGRFPRCHDTFTMVAPPPGEYRREAIQADRGNLAAHLAKEPSVVWPTEPSGPLEAGLRAWISRCLNLDPRRRPATMSEVAAGFEAVEMAVAAAAEHAVLLVQRRQARRRERRAWLAAGGIAAAAVALGVLWWDTDGRLRREQAAAEADKAALTGSARAALAAEVAATAVADRARLALARSQQLAGERLAAARGIGDHLFRWAMEQDHRHLPPLDGREHRLKVLANYYESFLKETADTVDLADLRTDARLQLAEIKLSAGQAAEAAQLLNDALKGWPGQGPDDAMKARIATDRLLLAQLYQTIGSSAVAAAFTDARKALAEVPVTPVNRDRLRQLTAVLDFQEAKQLTSTGEDGKALEQLLSASKALNDLASERPDCAVLASELGACYLSSASVLEGMGLLGDAREARAEAMKTLVEMLRKTPDHFGLRLELAGCYGAMAETAVLAGDSTGADGLSKEAIKLLGKLAAEQPANREVSARTAAQLGLAAGLLRDGGQAEEAIKSFDRAIRMLEGAHAEQPGNTMVAYRLGLLEWQRACTLGTLGKRDEEITRLGAARALLTPLADPGGTEAPSPEQVRRSLAYLLGDLGHALQLAAGKDKARTDEARKAFTDALDYWKLLVKARPDSEEYQEGESRCRERLAELK